MELKQVRDQRKNRRRRLLIVPYGIETTIEEDPANTSNLLIVPYGIETDGTSRDYPHLNLLIVPYGIETE